MNKYLSEFIGTFLLVLVGCGSIIICTENNISHAGLVISTAFGAIVAICVKWLHQYSGAHINPAVSFVVLVKKGFSLKEFSLYVLAQLAGAILAAFLLRLCFSDAVTLGQTIPKTTDAFVMEFAASMFLMLSVSLVPHKYVAYAAGIAVFLDAYFVGPFTGASMNPARSIGPALASRQFTGLWIYILAPMAGMYVGRLVTDYYKDSMKNIASK